MHNRLAKRFILCNARSMPPRPLRAPSRARRRRRRGNCRRQWRQGHRDWPLRQDGHGVGDRHRPLGHLGADFHLWRGTDPDNPDGYLKPNEDTTPADCVASSATTSTCSKTFTFEPDSWLTYADAGTWKVGIEVWANDDSRAVRDAYTTVRLQRFSKLTVNASPEPIAAGKSLTVTGRLTRANWDTDTYAGYTAQPVKLQFRKAGTSTYDTLQTVNTSSTGDLKATATASVDGYWRWNFAGTSTTPAVKATGDYVDVQ